MGVDRQVLLFWLLMYMNLWLTSLTQMVLKPYLQNNLPILLDGYVPSRPILYWRSLLRILEWLNDSLVCVEPLQTVETVMGVHKLACFYILATRLAGHIFMLLRSHLVDKMDEHNLEWCVQIRLAFSVICQHPSSQGSFLCALASLRYYQI